MPEDQNFSPFAPGFIIHCGVVFKCINTLQGACVSKKDIPGNFVLYLEKKKKKSELWTFSLLKGSHRENWSFVNVLIAISH